MDMQEFLAGLDPKTAKEIRMAAEVELKRLPLGSIGATEALGGGIGAGRITMIYGPESCGKSLLAAQSVAQWQKQGLTCAWVDVEGTWSRDFFAKVGVNNDDLILIQARSAGRIENDIKPLLRGNIDVIVVDSISDIMPEDFVDDQGGSLEFDKRKQMAAHAKTITRLVGGILYECQDTAVILLSQVTSNFLQGGYVELIPHGGKKTRHACSQIIKLTSSNTENNQIKGKIYVGDRIVEAPIGREVELYVVKNKLAPQSRKCKYDLYYAGNFVGIDTVGELIGLAEGYGVVEKKGAWYAWNGQQFQGKANFTEALRGDEGLQTLIKKEINERMTGEVVE